MVHGSGVSVKRSRTDEDESFVEEVDHGDADLFVKVNDMTGPAYYKVCSALIATSLVWRKRIYGGGPSDIYLRKTLTPWHFDIVGSSQRLMPPRHLVPRSPEECHDRRGPLDAFVVALEP